MEADLKQYLEAMEGRLNEQFNGLESRLEQRLVVLENGLERCLVETMREVQTELLRVFAAASGDQTIRFHEM